VSANDPAAAGATQGTARFSRLAPTGEAATAMQLAEEIAADASAPPERPFVMLNMISTADGRASIGGRSGPLSNEADRQLFHALRAVVDAVVVGAGTARAERYGRIIRDERVRRLRRERGLSEEPLACVVSGRLALPVDLPLLATPDAHVAIITSSHASLSGAAAQIEYLCVDHDGVVDLPRALAELHERFGVRTLLCEGGPHLNSHLLAASLVDQLLLSLAPKLAGGDAASGEALRIVGGPAFAAPLELDLRALLESDSHVFLRYAVRA
jgi:riboflavin-specific deaminase-like protein